MSLLRRRLKQLRTLLWTMLFLLIVSTAALVAAGRLLSPYIYHAKPWLERALSREFGTPVRVGMVGVEWQGLVPELALQHVTIGAPESALDMRQLRLRFEWYNYLLPRYQPWQVALRGAELVAEHDGGGWRLQGLVAGGGEPLDLGGLFGLGGVDLTDCDFVVATPDRRVTLRIRSLEVQHRGGGFAVAGRLALTGAPDISVRGEGSPGAGTTWRGYLTARDQPLAAWFAALGAPFDDGAARADLELWVEGRADEPLVLSSRLHLAAVGGDSNRTFDGTLWGRIAGAERWALTLGDARAAGGPHVTAAIAGLTVLRDERGWALSGTGIDLETLTPLALLARQAGIDGAPLALSGRIEHFALETDAEGVPRNADLVLADAAWVAAAGGVQLQALSGRLGLAGGSGEVEMAGVLEAPAVFAEALPFSDLRAVFSVSPGSGSAGGLRFDVTRLSGRAGALDLAGEGWVLTGDAPWLDLTLAVPLADADEIKRRLPYGVMGPNTGRWLRRSLEAGEVHDIRAQLHGALGDWPFAAGTGSFEAEGRLRQGRLRFNPQWPLLDEIDARLHFTAQEMRIDTAQARLGGVPLARVEARIADMDNAVLELDATSRGDAGAFLHLLGALPIAAGAWVEGSDLTLSGPSRVDTALTIDFRHGGSETTVDGQVHFAGVEARHGAQVEIDDIDGVLAFDEQRVIPSRLAAAWRAHPLHLDFEDAPFAVSLSGPLPLTEVLDLIGLDEYWQQRVAGSSVWRWTLLPSALGTRLLAGSDLLGVRLDLPTPLNKPAEWPLMTNVELAFGEPSWLGIDLGGRLAASLLLSGEAGVRGGALALGQRTTGMTHPGSIVLAGERGELDLSGWLAAVAAAPAVTGPVTVSAPESLKWIIDARPDRLELFGRPFHETAVRLVERRPYWQADFSGAAIEGQVRIPVERGSGEPLLADFGRLHLPPGQTTASSAAVDPRTLPSVHLYAGDFRWEDWDLGSVRVQAFPVAGGLRFETIEAISPAVRLTGQGDWRRLVGDTRSSVRLTFDAEKLGELLIRLGYDPILQGGQTAITLSGEWPGGPADFTLAALDGQLQLDIRQGVITEAGAGVGRVLGLISLQALPRRLLLDFRDVFESGFSFDRARGTFRLAAGYAATDDLEISAPNARLLITGRTDLVRQRYDQQLIVMPGVGSTLPLIGAIAGPIGIAAGAALQGILGKPLGGISQRVYTITGPWNAPLIEHKGETSGPAAADGAAVPAAGPETTDDDADETDG